MKNRSEVIICGDGLFATLCSIELQKKGVQTLRLCSSDIFFAHSQKGLGVFWSTQPDPPTRAEVAHGHELAVYLNSFLARGVQLAQAKMQELSSSQASFQADFQKIPTLRLALQTHEVSELKKAETSFDSLKRVADTTVSAQIWSEPDSLLLHKFEPLAEALLHEEPEHSRRFAPVTQINEKGTHVEAVAADGQVYVSEVCVLGAGANSGKILPRYESVVIPVNDALTRAKFKITPLNAQAEALCFRASSGHVSGVLQARSDELSLELTGPRYALPLAGIGNFHADELPKINATVWEQIQKVCPAMIEALLATAFSSVNPKVGCDFKTALLLEQHVYTDCLPCDELPLLGEWGTKGRILGNAGWLGCGHSAAFEAARIVCELVLNGKSTDLHPLLSPKRLQSMSF